MQIGPILTFSSPRWKRLSAGPPFCSRAKDLDESIGRNEIVRGSSPSPEDGPSASILLSASANTRGSALCKCGRDGGAPAQAPREFMFLRFYIKIKSEGLDKVQSQ